MATVREIAPEVYVLTVERSPSRFVFNHFLLRGKESVLVHAGMRSMFDELRKAVESLVNPSQLRWIAVSHFEADECGALGEWRSWATGAQALCSATCKQVNLDDTFGPDCAAALEDGGFVETGAHRLRMVRTPHVPHGWDAALFYEETQGTLFCSDLFHRASASPCKTVEDLVAGSLEHLFGSTRSDSPAYTPRSPTTKQVLLRLANLHPTCLATMHGEPFRGDASRALALLADALDGGDCRVEPDSRPDRVSSARACAGTTRDQGGSTSRRGTA